MNLYELPPSPFEKEKALLNDEKCLLGSCHPRARNADPRPRLKVTLTVEERQYIAMTGRKVPAEKLAEDFDIPKSYVYKLRDRYRYPHREKIYNKRGTTK